MGGADSLTWENIHFSPTDKRMVYVSMYTLIVKDSVHTLPVSPQGCRTIVIMVTIIIMYCYIALVHREN